MTQPFDDPQGIPASRTIAKGIIKSYASGSHTANVQLVGSHPAVLTAIRVATDIPAADVVAGRQCTVLFLDPANQDDALVLTIQGALPSGGGGGGSAADVQEGGSTVKADADPLDFRTGFDIAVDGAGVNIKLAVDEFTYDAIVDGVGADAGFHATLAAAIATSGVKAILVIANVNTESITVASGDPVRLIRALHKGIAGPTFTSIAKAGLAVSGFTLTDETIDINADRVAIENCDFDATGGNRSGIDINSGSDDVRISGCTWLANNSTYAIDAAVGGTALRCRISDCVFTSGVAGTNAIRLENLADDAIIEGCAFYATTCSGDNIFMDDGGSTTGGADGCTVRNCLMTLATNGGIEWKGQRGLLANTSIEIDGSAACVEAHYFPASLIVGCTFRANGSGANTVYVDDTNTTTSGLNTKAIVGCVFEKVASSADPHFAIKCSGSFAGYWTVTGNAFQGLSGGGASVFDINTKAGVTFVGNVLKSSNVPLNLGTDTLIEANGGTGQIAAAGHHLMQVDDAHDIGAAAQQVRYYYGKPVLRAYTVATRPAGVPAGTVIFVSDGGAGAVFQGYNGAAWVNLG